MDDPLVIDNRAFTSRLMLGTGKYSSNDVLANALKFSGSEIITVAIRRIDLQNSDSRELLSIVDPMKFQILPNTAGCTTSKDAIYTAELARELLNVNWIKVEVIYDEKYLLPDPLATYKTCEHLLNDNFVVLPYIGADPALAKALEELGCATVMPLGSPIGSGRGVLTLEEIEIILEQSNIPVVVDAGLGVPSDAAKAMEAGADAVLVNTAIAHADKPAKMANAFKLGVQAGREAFLSGRTPAKKYASASSPLTGIIGTSK